MTDEQQPRPLDAARVELLSRAVRSSRELCELLWEAMHQELRHHPREERVRELSERLSEVASTVAMLTVAPHGGASPGERRTRPESVSAEQPVERPSHLSPVPGDDGARVPSLPTEPQSPMPDAPTPTVPAASDSLARMRLVDEHLHAPSVHPQAPSAHPQAPQASTALPQSVRREEGASAWINTVGRLLERHAVDGLPFAVLLVEVVDVAHIERSDSPVQVNNLIAQVEHALGRALRSEDSLTRESFGRYWLVAPETNGTGARMLAERLARLVRSSASHRGVPLEVAIGIAVCPEDGTDAPALAARADLGVYTARANGRPVARTDPHA
ncbi:MAG: diguanylate cyclase domain-containing protein [Solirubrobacteraceae bacterium]